MALVRCNLSKFLGVVCHCFPLPLDVPTFAARCLHVRNDARDPSSERWNYRRERLSSNFANVASLFTPLGIFYMPQIYDMGTSTVRAIKFVGKYQKLFEASVFERQKFESKNTKWTPKEIKKTKSTNIADLKPRFPHYSVASKKVVMWNQTNTRRTADEFVRPLVQTATHNSMWRLGCSETPAVVINGLYVEQPSAVLLLSKSSTFR